MAKVAALSLCDIPFHIFQAKFTADVGHRQVFLFHISQDTNAALAMMMVANTLVHKKTVAM